MFNEVQEASLLEQKKLHTHSLSHTHTHTSKKEKQLVPKCEATKKGRHLETSAASICEVVESY